MSKHLFEDFPPVSSQDWMALIEKDLKGADFDKKLVWSSPEGFKVKPFYRKEDVNQHEYLLGQVPGQYPYVRGKKSSSNKWSICQAIHQTNLEDANKALLTALSRGADSIALTTKISSGQLFGQRIRNQQDFNSLLHGINLSSTEIHFSWGNQCPQALAYLCENLIGQGLNSYVFKGSFEFDPIGEILSKGKWPKNEAVMWDNISAYLGEAKEKFPKAKHLVLQTANCHRAGSSLSQDLAYILSSAVEMIDAFTKRGWKVEDVLSLMGVKAEVATSYFMEIAFFRALRLLWSAMVKSYGVTGEHCELWIHAETSRLNKTIYDPHVNILRESSEAMSAVLGGIDVLTVHPWDNTFREPTEASDRLARNTQLVIREETGFSHCVDSAAGSYYIEELTDKLAESAWRKFITREGQGGLLKDIKNGLFQKEITQSRDEMKKAVSSRRQTILGCNQYPNVQDKFLNQLKNDPGQNLLGLELLPTNSHISQLQQKTLKGLSWADPFLHDTVSVMELPVYRLAEDFEKLRLEGEAWSNQHGKTLKVYLWTFGQLAFRKARATFCANLYGCAGFEVLENNGELSVAEHLVAIEKCNPAMVVFCSSDPEYGEILPSILPLLVEKYSKAIRVVAGYPQDILEKLQQAGIQEFVHVKTDAKTYLNNCVERLGGLQ